MSHLCTIRAASLLLACKLRVWCQNKGTAYQLGSELHEPENWTPPTKQMCSYGFRVCSVHKSAWLSRLPRDCAVRLSAQWTKRSSLKKKKQKKKAHTHSHTHTLTLSLLSCPCAGVTTSCAWWPSHSWTWLGSPWRSPSWTATAGWRGRASTSSQTRSSS